MDLDAIFDEAHGIAPSAATPEPQGFTDLGTIGLSSQESPPLDLDAIFDNAHSGQSTPAASDWSGVLGQVGKGLSFGFLDEVQGLEGAAGNELANLIGYGNDKGFWENYERIANVARAEDEAYEKANPKTAFALNLLGAAAPAVATGGASLLARGGAEAAKQTAARGALPWISRNLYGVGITEAPSVFQLAKMGAMGGALAGAGEANDGSRARGAMIGGAAGAVLAPVVGKGIEHGFGYVANKAAEHGISPGAFVSDVTAMLRDPKAAERGAFSIGGVPTGGGLAPEELVLAKQLKNVPLDKVQTAAQEMQETGQAGIPLFLPEAIDAAKVQRNARHIASNEHSMDYSRAAIDARTEGAEQRATTLFDAISPEQSSYEGASKMALGANDIIEGAKQTRKDLTDPLYEQAYKASPKVISPTFDDLFAKDARLRQAITSVKKSAGWSGLPDNSTKLLVRARHELSNQIEGAIANGRGRLAADLTDTYNQLNAVLHKNQALLNADLAFGNESAKIEELTGSFLKGLQDLSADKVQSVGQLFKLPAERISALRQEFAKAGKLEQWNAGVRAHLQNVVEGTGEGSNFTKQIIGNTLKQDKLRAALGETYEAVAKGLDLEDRMFKGKNMYYPGSSTQGNQAEAAEFEKNTSIIKKLFDRDFVGTISALFNGGLPEEVAQGLAQIYFNPARGAESLGRILPLLEQYAQNRAAAGKLGSLSGSSSSRALPALSEHGQISPLSQQTRSQTGGTAVPQSQSPQSTAHSSGSASQGSKEQYPSFNDNSVETGTQLKGGGDLKKTSFGIAAGAGFDPLDQAFNNLQSGNNMADTKVSQDTGTPLPRLVRAVIQQESSGNPKAVSDKGAVGLMQVMPATAKEWHAKLQIEEPLDLKDPEQNKVIGTAYLGWLLDHYDGDEELALTAYHSGYGRVDDLLKAHKATTFAEIRKYLGPVGQRYAPEVLGRLGNEPVEV